MSPSNQPMTPIQDPNATLSTKTATTEPPWTPPNGIHGHYALHCHCGAIRFSMTLSPPLYASEVENQPVDKQQQCVAVECDCSHCERQSVLAVHTFTKDVVWERGLDQRGEYLCGAKMNPHFFCKKCGCMLATDLTGLMKNILKVPEGEERMTVNVSCGALSFLLQVVVMYADTRIGAHAEGL